MLTAPATLGSPMEACEANVDCARNPGVAHGSQSLQTTEKKKKTSPPNSSRGIFLKAIQKHFLRERVCENARAKKKRSRNRTPTFARAFLLLKLIFTPDIGRRLNQDHQKLCESNLYVINLFVTFKC